MCEEQKKVVESMKTEMEEFKKKADETPPPPAEPAPIAMDTTEKTQVLYITLRFLFTFSVVCCLPLLCCFVSGVGGDNRSTAGCHTNHVCCEY